MTNFFFIVSLVPLLAVLGIIQLLRGRSGKASLGRLQILLVTLYGLAFMAVADARFLAVMSAVVVWTYCFALIIDNAVNNGRKTIALRSTILAGGGVLVCLAYFKYADFFIDGFRRALGLERPLLSLALPLGLSFYALTALGYLVDVYKGRCRAERNLVDLALFITFFPKVVSGPIVRSEAMIPQIKSYRGLKADAFRSGAQVFLIGLFKKMVLADRLGVFVNDVWRSPMAFSTGTVAWAVASYAMQIYFDFSGYSDMAIGLSKILGFDLERNFNLPYLAGSLSEFWRRWHISLSAWLRDYIYIPLGGSRKGKGRTCANLMVVFLVSGLWHGTGTTFLIWGVLHGLGSCLERAIRRPADRTHYDGGGLVAAVGALVRNLATLAFVALLWIPFRSESVGKMWMVFKALLTTHEGIRQPYSWSFMALACLVAASAAAAVSGRRKGGGQIDGFYPLMDLRRFWPQALFYTFIGVTLILAYMGDTAFIYAAF